MDSYDSPEMPPIFGETPIAMIGHDPMRTMPGIFIGGCNLRCPYCINRSIIMGNGRTSADPIAVLNGFMLAREPWIFVSGGEPLSNPATLNLLDEIHRRKMKVALATNGTYPERLAKVISVGLVDYVVMDIKSSPYNTKKYMAVCGTSDEEVLGKTLESIVVLKRSSVECEFRTTCCAKFIDLPTVKEIAELIGPDFPYVLQYYTTHQTLVPDMANKDYVTDYDTLLQWVEEIRPMVKWAVVREV